MEALDYFVGFPLACMMHLKFNLVWWATLVLHCPWKPLHHRRANFAAVALNLWLRAAGVEIAPTRQLHMNPWIDSAASGRQRNL